MRVAFVHLGRENLGIEYLSAVLRKEGHRVSLAYDPGLFGINDNVLYVSVLERIFDRRDRVRKELEEANPEVVAFSVYTGTYRWALDMASWARERLGVPVVFGGIHPTLVPEEVVQRPQVDYVVVGEGEEALLELLDHIESGKRPRRVANLWYREGEEIISNPPRPPLGDLDALPLPDKSLFQEEINYADDYLVLSARGCPYRCSYCCESYLGKLYQGQFFRRRSVTSVLQELKTMKERYGIREVMFSDPIFFTHRRWLRELMERYRDEVGVPFRCFGKVSFLDDEVAEWLRWGGCYAIEFGLQSWNPEIRREVLNRSESNAAYEKAFRILDRVGIRYDIDHMMGLPGESLQDYLEAVRFYGSLKRLNRIKPHHLTYFPKMEILRQARNEGLLNQEEEERIVRGEEVHDFFHQASAVDWIRDMEVFLKILPLLPYRILSWVLRREWWRGWRRCPAALVALFQWAVALRGRDYRFFLYLKYYLLRLRRALRLLPLPRALASAVIMGCASLATVPLGDRLKDAGVLHVAGILLGGAALWNVWKSRRRSWPP